MRGASFNVSGHYQCEFSFDPTSTSIRVPATYQAQNILTCLSPQWPLPNETAGNFSLIESGFSVPTHTSDRDSVPILVEAGGVDGFVNPNSGTALGGFNNTLSGNGFNVGSGAYQVSMAVGPGSEVTGPCFVQDATEVTCTVPEWEFGETAVQVRRLCAYAYRHTITITDLRVWHCQVALYQGGVLVPQSGAGNGLFGLDAGWKGIASTGQRVSVTGMPRLHSESE